MLDFFKHIFQRKPGKNGHPESPSLPPTPSSTLPATGTRTLAQPKHPVHRATPGQKTTVDLSLQAVFGDFAPELKRRIKQCNVGQATVSVPIDKVLPQLTLGSVKISFGELRRAAPQLFTSGSDCDAVPVKLPLEEILAQIDSSLFVRRHGQKQIVIPDEIRSPFGDGAKGLALSAGPSRTQAPAAPLSTLVARTAPQAFQPPSSPAPVRPQAPRPPTAPTTPAAPQFTPQRSVPFHPIGTTPTPHTPNIRPAGAPPTIAAPPAFRGVGTSNPPATPREAAPQYSAPTPPAAARPPVHQPVRPITEPAAAPLCVSLKSLAEAWPDALRQEIAQLNLGEAKVVLPAELAEQALKRGKVAFPWKVLRSWIKPAPLPTVSVHDNAVLDLPLKVIAPLFFSRSKEQARSQQKVAVDESIPNLFFGGPGPVSTPASASAPGSSASPAPTGVPRAKPVDTNFYTWNDASESDVVGTDFIQKAEPSPGTTFVTRYATPNEVVSRAAALEGVAGALIALPDGLMVASRLSADLNGDTLAAFLPHIFGKVNQCTKELRMGELNNLNFTVGKVPWKIFRVNAIFFAAFGRAGQPLPTGQLAALAAELDRKKTVS